MMATAADALTRFVGRLHTGTGTSSWTPSRSTADAPPPTVPGDEPHLGCSHWLQPYYTSAPLYLLLDTFTLHRNRTAAGRTPRSWSPSRTGSVPVHLQVPLQVSRSPVPTPAVTWYYYNDLTELLVTTVLHLRAAGTCSWTPSRSTATAPPPPVQYYYLRAVGTCSWTPSRSATAPPPALQGDEPHLGCSLCQQPYAPRWYLDFGNLTLFARRTAADRTESEPHLGYSHFSRTPCRWYFALDDLTLHGNRTAAAGHYLRTTGCATYQVARCLGSQR